MEVKVGECGCCGPAPTLNIRSLEGGAQQMSKAKIIGLSENDKSDVFTSFQVFLDRKAQLEGMHGFDPTYLHPDLFDFQSDLVTWAVNKGRAAIMADCGLGKTLMQLVWAQNVVERTNGNVLILAPLAVSGQIVREAEKFGIEASKSNDGRPSGKITITNYEKLDKFDSSDFVGCVCDESSVLKNFNGARKTEITAFMRKMKYRLLCSATAAPNDYIELGTSSEALGYLGHMDMLNRFFKNDLNNSASGRMRGQVIKWRFKGHAEIPFWQWVSGWARAVRKPSDLGYSDDRFILPPLVEHQHVVSARVQADGMLFSLPAVGLAEQRDERNRTIQERCETAAALVDTGQPAIVWCHGNEEGKLLRSMIGGSVEVAGSDSDDAKEERLLAFASGQARVLVTKPKIGAWGLNFQHCNHMTFFPSHSFEQYYQAVRRCWRFGQKRPVRVDIVATEGEADVLKNLQRKSAQADRMFEGMVAQMNNAVSIGRQRNFTKEMEIPTWL
jgi:hypothetical protein